jgi:hypothetical protein
MMGEEEGHETLGEERRLSCKRKRESEPPPQGGELETTPETGCPRLPLLPPTTSIEKGETDLFDIATGEHTNLTTKQQQELRGILHSRLDQFRWGDPKSRIAPPQPPTGDLKDPLLADFGNEFYTPLFRCKFFSILSKGYRKPADPPVDRDPGKQHRGFRVNFPTWLNLGVGPIKNGPTRKESPDYTWTIHDMLVSTRTWKQHKDLLTTLLITDPSIEEVFLPSWCRFGYREVQYGGHRISERGLLPPTAFFEWVKDNPCPHDGSSARAFLGQVIQYRKFIPRYNQITQMAYTIKKGGDSRPEEYQQLQRAIQEIQPLGVPDMGSSQPFMMKVTMDLGRAMVSLQLQQRQGPRTRVLLHDSRRMGVGEVNDNPEKTEVTIAKQYLQRWEAYVHTHPVVVVTQLGQRDYVQETAEQFCNRTQPPAAPTMVWWMRFVPEQGVPLVPDIYRHFRKNWEPLRPGPVIVAETPKYQGRYRDRAYRSRGHGRWGERERYCPPQGFISDPSGRPKPNPRGPSPRGRNQKPGSVGKGPKETNFKGVTSGPSPRSELTNNIESPIPLPMRVFGEDEHLDLVRAWLKKGFRPPPQEIDITSPYLMSYIGLWELLTLGVDEAVLRLPSTGERFQKIRQCLPQSTQVSFILRMHQEDGYHRNFQDTLYKVASAAYFPGLWRKVECVMDKCPPCRLGRRVGLIKGEPQQHLQLEILGPYHPRLTEVEDPEFLILATDLVTGGLRMTTTKSPPVPGTLSEAMTQPAHRYRNYPVSLAQEIGRSLEKLYDVRRLLSLRLADWSGRLATTLLPHLRELTGATQVLPSALQGGPGEEIDQIIREIQADPSLRWKGALPHIQRIIRNLRVPGKSRTKQEINLIAQGIPGAPPLYADEELLLLECYPMEAPGSLKSPANPAKSQEEIRPPPLTFNQVWRRCGGLIPAQVRLACPRWNQHQFHPGELVALFTPSGDQGSPWSGPWKIRSRVTDLLWSLTVHGEWNPPLPPLTVAKDRLSYWRDPGKDGPSHPRPAERTRLTWISVAMMDEFLEGSVAKVLPPRRGSVKGTKRSLPTPQPEGPRCSPPGPSRIEGPLMEVTWVDPKGQRVCLTYHPDGQETTTQSKESRDLRVNTTQQCPEEDNGNQGRPTHWDSREVPPPSRVERNLLLVTPSREGASTHGASTLLLVTPSREGIKNYGTIPSGPIPGESCPHPKWTTKSSLMGPDHRVVVIDIRQRGAEITSTSSRGPGDFKRRRGEP